MPDYSFDLKSMPKHKINKPHIHRKMFFFSKSGSAEIPWRIRWNCNENRNWDTAEPSVRMKGNQNQKQKLWGKSKRTEGLQRKIPQKSGNKKKRNEMTLNAPLHKKTKGE